jgi:hypothetical protein
MITQDRGKWTDENLGFALNSNPPVQTPNSTNLQTGAETQKRLPQNLEDLSPGGNENRKPTIGIGTKDGEADPTGNRLLSGRKDQWRRLAIGDRRIAQTNSLRSL